MKHLSNENVTVCTASSSLWLFMDMCVRLCADDEILCAQKSQCHRLLTFTICHEMFAFVSITSDTKGSL